MVKIIRMSWESHEAQFPKISVFTWPTLDASSLFDSKGYRWDSNSNKHN